MGICTIKDKEGNELSDQTITKSCFNFINVIGRGGFGKVWKIEKKSSGKQYAVKEISKVRLFEMNSVSSVMNERRLLAHLRHPFIINMHYAFQEKEHLYIVMDYKQGGDLRYHINKNKGGFSEDQVSKKISLTLEFMHHNCIMHRDIKPENLVFDDKGYLFLTDMGIARLFTLEKMVLDNSGTPAYMAPEIITNQPHDLSSDYYSIGIMLYELMLGKRPYGGRSKKEIKEQILSREVYLKYSDLPINWNNEAADLINRLLKRKSETRIGKKGIWEIKSHLWFKQIDWEKLYRKELISPYSIIITGENFNKEFVNTSDKIDKSTYDIILKKMNRENLYNQFYFNLYDSKKEKYFEYQGLFYKFHNLHEEENNSQLPEKDENNKTLTNNKKKNDELSLSNNASKKNII